MPYWMPKREDILSPILPLTCQAWTSHEKQRSSREWRAGSSRMKRCGLKVLIPPEWVGLEQSDFRTKVTSLDPEFEARVTAASANGGALRYVATITPAGIDVGLKVIAPGSPLWVSRGLTIWSFFSLIATESDLWW